MCKSRMVTINAANLKTKQSELSEDSTSWNTANRITQWNWSELVGYPFVVTANEKKKLKIAGNLMVSDEDEMTTLEKRGRWNHETG